MLGRWASSTGTSRLSTSCGSRYNAHFSLNTISNKFISGARQQRNNGPRHFKAAAETVSISTPSSQVNAGHDHNQTVREGHYEASLVQQQATKGDSAQPSIASALKPPSLSRTYDVAVVGAGPAGMYLAAELAKQGLSTVVVGHDMPLVNNYGVWVDEAESLGIMHTLDKAWDDAICYFDDEQQFKLARGYGRVCRRKLRDHLLKICSAAGVEFLAAQVEDVKVTEDGKQSRLTLPGGCVLQCRLVTLAAGAAAGKFLRYEDDAPSVAVQTAYGIEAEVEGYDEAYPTDAMLFMDFRRHHTGVHDGAARRLKKGAHPAGGDGLWGTQGEVPSFLYAMPLHDGKVFLEETCLVAKPALPFAVLKRRLERRMRAMGLKVKKVHDEEWSYIPVGGPLPEGNQQVTAFGAAANLVHPATGFSVSRSFREAPGLAQEMAQALRSRTEVHAISSHVWETLWPQERRTQTAFHVFGMEMLASLDLADTNAFFEAFFKLPTKLWRGYMASQLSSSELIYFALYTFFVASPRIKFLLVAQLFTDPSGKYVAGAYRALYDQYQRRKAEQEAAAAPRDGVVPAPEASRNGQNGADRNGA